MKYGVIYKHTNKVNGKIYIGQTTQDIDRRWRKGQASFPAYRSNQYFTDSLKKYGWNNFESEVLVSCNSQESLDSIEIQMIELYDCLQPKGYNSKLGGNGGKLSDTTKEKIGAAHFGKIRNEAAWNRTEIIMINDIKSKECAVCKTMKSLDNYCQNKKLKSNGEIEGDGLNTRCRTCAAEYQKQYSYKRVSEERVNQSYKARGEKSAQRMKDHFSTDEAKREKSLTYGGYKSVNITTGEVKIWDCGHDLKLAGFKLPAISNALDNPNRTAKGCKWYKINNNK